MDPTFFHWIPDLTMETHRVRDKDPVVASVSYVNKTPFPTPVPFFVFGLLTRYYRKSLGRSFKYKVQKTFSLRIDEFFFVK